MLETATSSASGLSIGTSASASTSTAARGDLSSTGRAAFEDVTISVGDQEVPVALWRPLDGADGSTPGTSYPHRISVAKIARVLLRLGTSLPTFLDKALSLDANVQDGVERAPDVTGSAAAAARAEQDLQETDSDSGRGGGTVKGALILCHGYLGSRFDLCDIAEAASKGGFVCVAPEFAESLSNPQTTPANLNGGSATRGEIVQSCLDLLESRFGIDARRTALVGHSAGAGTAVLTEGRYLGRVAIAGFRKPPGPPQPLLSDPLLVICSENDNVISLAGILSELSQVGAPTETYDGSAESLAELARTPPTPGQVALVKYENGKWGEGRPAPCHISFLSERTNDAMVEVLSPLLPLAKALGIPLLDFDTYSENRDSVDVARDLVPAIVSWLTRIADADIG